MYKLRKVSRTITSIAGCKIDIVILFPTDKDVISKYIKKEGYDDLVYLTYNLLGIIGITFPTKDNENKYLSLTEFRKTQLVSLMEKTLSVLNNNNIFYKDANNRLCINEQNIYNYKNQIGDTIIALKPIIVYDEKNDIDYEGARIFINNRSSYVDFTTMELFSICNLLNRIDIFLYSQSLFNSIVESFKKRSVEENFELKTVEGKLDTILDFNI